MHKVGEVMSTRNRRRMRAVVKETRPIKRVVLYLRISRDREHQTSLTTQEKELRSMCEYHGWEIVKVLKDPGRSAYKGVFRPEFEEALSMIESGQVDAICVYKVDRFTRNITEFWNSWEAIKNAGGHFVSKVDRFDTSDEMGLIMMGLIAGFAQAESAMKSDRAKSMHRHQKEQGKVGPGQRPYGYKRVNSQDRTDGKGKGAILMPIAKEAALIRTAADWVINGGSLLGFIHEHQPKSSRANKMMTYRGLRLVLTNPTTAGLRAVTDDEFAQGEWPAILDRETWDQLRVILLDPARKTGHGNQRANLLSGVMTCRKCGKGVTARNWVHPTKRTITKRYVCGGGCHTSLDMASADMVAIEALFDKVPESTWQAWQASGKGWDESVRESILAKLQAVDRMWSDPASKMTEARWFELSAELNSQLEAADNEEPLNIPTAASLRQSWDSFDLFDKQRVLTQAFDTIELLGQAGSRDPHTRMSFD